MVHSLAMLCISPFQVLPGEEDEQLVGEAAEALQLAKLQAQQTPLLQGVKPSKKDHLVFHQWEIVFEMYACCACLSALRCQFLLTGGGWLRPWLA